MDDQQRARELLVQEYERDGITHVPDCIRREAMLTTMEDRAIRAITAALRTVPEVLHIRVRNNGEYGSFYLREGVECEGDRRRYWCELTCNTAFGVVGHHWSHMGKPAAQFLTKVGRDYVVDKLWGMESRIFDADKAMADVRRMILRDRRAGELDHQQARNRWESVEMGADNEFEFHSLVNETDWLHEVLYEGGFRDIGKVDNPQAVGFWKHLWPDFLAQLNVARPQGGK